MPFTVTPWAKDYLASGSTALAQALLIERRDGVRVGYTNIRRSSTLPAYTVGAITVASTRYDSKARMSVTNLEQSERPEKTDNWECTLITGDWLPADDIANNLFFGARYVLVFFDWRTNTPIMLRIRGKVGEHRIDGEKVVFKMRSLSQLLQQEVLDVTSPLSRATWGDPELAFFNLNGNTNDGFPARIAGAITGVDGSYPRRRFTLAGLSGIPALRFNGGIFEMQTGPNVGAKRGIVYCDNGSGVVTLDSDLRYPLVAGQSVRIQIREPLTLNEWKAYFGTGFKFAGEPEITTLEQASSVTSSR